MAIRPRVLFLCTENSCRTQMAEAFLRALTGKEFEIVSAGAQAGRLDPEAVIAMREVGIDISSARTKIVDPYLRERFHYVITLCDREQERSCPVFRAPSGDRRGTLRAPLIWRLGALIIAWQFAMRAMKFDGMSPSSRRNTIARHQEAEQHGTERSRQREIRAGRAARAGWQRVRLLRRQRVLRRQRRSDHIESIPLR